MPDAAGFYAPSMARQRLARASMHVRCCVPITIPTASKQLRTNSLDGQFSARLLPHTVTIIYNKKADCNFERSAQFYSLLYINLSNTQPAQLGLLTPWYMPWLHLHKSQSVPMVLYIHHVDVFLFPMLSHYILR